MSGDKKKGTKPLVFRSQEWFDNPNNPGTRAVNSKVDVRLLVLRKQVPTLPPVTRFTFS